MKRTSIYKSEQGKKEVLQLYDKLLAEITIPLQRLRIDTRFGETHVIKLGNHDGPPLFTFHGGNSLNPYDLKNLLPLSKDYCIYAPDTIGHPGYSAETRLSPKNLEYGEWALDLLDGLDIVKANFIGPSFGGGILARLATIAPERIQSAIFVVPTGFVKSSLTTMLTKLVVPMMIYMIAPSEKRLERVVEQLADELDPDLLAITELVFKHVKTERDMPRPAKKDEFAQLQAPVMLITAERDVLNPGREIIERGKEIIPNLVEYECLENVPHAFYTATGQRDYVIAKISTFLKEYSG
ncbi:MAG: alpha/beta hydrolase [Candidatus Thorarchaeota archaeon]